MKPKFEKPDIKPFLTQNPEYDFLCFSAEAGMPDDTDTSGGEGADGQI